MTYSIISTTIEVSITSIGLLSLSTLFEVLIQSLNCHIIVFDLNTMTFDTKD